MSAESSSVEQDDITAGQFSSFQGGSSSTKQHLRRNQTILIPIPIPHLTKKSRERKVPHANAQSSQNTAAGATGTDDDNSDEGGHTARRSSSRRDRGGDREGPEDEGLCAAFQDVGNVSCGGASEEAR